MFIGRIARAVVSTAHYPNPELVIREMRKQNDPGQPATPMGESCHWLRYQSPRDFSEPAE